MDVDIALYTLDKFARGGPVSDETARLAATFVAHYVDFMELYASPDAVSVARKDIRLVAGQPAYPGDFLAVVTLGGDDYVVAAYSHLPQGSAMRMAERELAQNLTLRAVEIKTASAQNLPLFTTVISAATPLRKTKPQEGV